MKLATQSIALTTLLSVSLLPLAAQAKTETVDIPIPKAAISTAFNAAFSSTKLHLDNYGEKHGVSWHEDSSYILFPNGSKKQIPIAEHEYEITNGRKLKHYIDNMNTSSLQASIDGNRIQMTANFESQGEEIKGKCIRKKINGNWTECSLNMERDIQLNNTMISVSLIPVAYKGSISFSNPEADFKTDLQISSKLCQAFKGICGKIEKRIKNELTNTIETKLVQGLNNEDVKSKVAHSIKNAPSVSKYLDEFKNWKVVKIESKGSNYIVTLSN